MGTRSIALTSGSLSMDAIFVDMTWKSGSENDFRYVKLCVIAFSYS